MTPIELKCMRLEHEQHQLMSMIECLTKDIADWIEAADFNKVSPRMAIDVERHMAALQIICDNIEHGH